MDGSSETRYTAWGEVRERTLPHRLHLHETVSYNIPEGGTADFGLMFYNARWYDSSLGRFAQADSIMPGGAQGWDRYACTNNNPIRYTDPSGQDAYDNCGGNAACMAYMNQTEQVNNLKTLLKNQYNWSVRTL